MLEFLKIYDDFVRAKQVFTESNVETEGLDGILKNMDSLLVKYQVKPIDALGEIFDPNYFGDDLRKSEKSGICGKIRIRSRDQSRTQSFRFDHLRIRSQ